jgi:thymidine kinase
MNAGKSTSLLQIAHNYEEQGQTVVLFTAGIDDYGQRVVEGTQVEIGGNNSYQQVCARCFHQDAKAL